MLLVGIVALLGTSALADLPVINEMHANWGGCDYAIKVRQDVNPYPYPQPLYRIAVERAVISHLTCFLQPGSVELATSKLVPQIAIVSGTQGVAVAYSSGEYVRGMGNWVRVSIRQIDPTTLNSVRVAGLQASYVPANGGAGNVGAVSLEGMSLSSTTLRLVGTFAGNAITEDPSPVPWPYPIVQGNHFIADYPNFFSSTQAATITTY